MSRCICCEIILLLFIHKPPRLLLKRPLALLYNRLCRPILAGLLKPENQRSYLFVLTTLWALKNIYCQVSQLGTLSYPTSTAKFGNLTADVYNHATQAFRPTAFPYDENLFFFMKQKVQPLNS